jgi:uncharacterized membrane protein YhiD involved in acid resistance
MFLTVDDLLKLGLAVLLARLVGAEREFHDKAAGLRTMILISVGATLFTVFSLSLGGDQDPVRIAASIVSGIGFLGADQWAFTAAPTGVILVVLLFFPRLELGVDSLRHTTTYEVVFRLGADRREELQRPFGDCRLRVRNVRLSKSSAGHVYRIDVYGPPRCHEQAVGELLQHADLLELRA